MTRSVSSTLFGVLFVVAIAGLSAGPAWAGDYTWTGTTNALWSNAANWGSAGPPVSGDIAEFSSGTANAAAIDIGAGITVNTIQFDTGAGSITIGQASPTGTITMNDNGSIIYQLQTGAAVNETIKNNISVGPTFLTLTNSNTGGGSNVNMLTLSGNITGSGTITVTGPLTGNGSQINLNGNNSGFTGTIVINGGQLAIGSATALGDAAHGTIINAGGQLRLNNTAGIVEPITVAGNSSFTAGNTAQFAGAFTLLPGVTFQPMTGGGNAVNLNGSITGDSTAILDVLQRGLTLSGATANTFAGTVLVRASASITQSNLTLNKTGVNAISGPLQVVANNNFTIVQWSQNDQINDNSVVSMSSTASTSGNAVLRLAGHTDTIGGLTSNNTSIGNCIIENQVVGSSVAKLTVSPSAGAIYTFGGLIRNGTASTGFGTMSFGMSGSGQEILTGAETYTGATTVNGGTLTINGSLSSGSITVSGGDFSGSGAINFGSGSPNGEITVNSSGTVDASSGMLWNIAGLSVASGTLADFTGGGTFIQPGNLGSLIGSATLAYNIAYTGNQVVITKLLNNTWNVDASANWSSSASWTGGSVPNGSAIPANFGSVITASRTVNLDIPVTLGSMNFANTNQYTVLDTTGTNNITLANGAGNASINVTAGSHVVNAGLIIAGNNVLDLNVTPSTGTLTIGGNISEFTPGSGVLNTVAASTGTVLLSGSNSFTGGVNVNGGALIAGGGSALAATVQVNVQGGATFGLNAATDNQTIGSLNCVSPSAIIAPNGGTLNVAANGNNNIFGLTGAGTVILTAATSSGTQTFASNGNYNGSLIIVNGQIATTQGNATGAFHGTGGTTTLINANWGNPSNSHMDSTGESFYITGGGTSTFYNYGAVTLSGNFAVDVGAQYTQNTGGGNGVNYSGVISGGGTIVFSGGGAQPINIQGTLANTFSGTSILPQGTLILQKPAGVNAIAGPLTIGTAGVASVQLAANEQINPSVVVTFADNTSDLRLKGFNETLGGLASSFGNGVVGNYGSTASTLTIATAGMNDFSGMVANGASGPLALVVNGSGVQTFSGTNTYTGGTTVAGGVLGINGPLAHANITVSGGTFNGAGTITFNAGEEIIIGAAGTFDASGGMLWDIAGLAGSPINLADFTSGGTFVQPGTLNSLLTPASAAIYSLSDVGNVIEAIALASNTWNVDASGNWSDPGNWQGGNVPNGAHAPANFLGAITASRTVNLDIPVTVGSMDFNNANQYTLLDTTGTNSITLDNGAAHALIQVDQGSHVIAAPVALNSPLGVTVTPSGSTLTISGNISENNVGMSLNVGGAGTLLLTGSNTFTGAISVNSGSLIVGGGNACWPAPCR